MINFLSKLSPYFIQLGGLTIHWYALFIVTGAFLAYYISRYFFKKHGHNPDIIDNLLIICFPAGILGARIWFCLSNLELYANELYRIFFFWEPGLAIQGGVIAGISAGIIYLRKCHKELKINYMLDIVVPNILIAQVLGRWGNFFNQEVYGACVEKSQLWFLPSFILNQMQGGGGILCQSSMYAQPLFLYESILNFIGFILISFVLRLKWKKRKDGDLFALYFIWYGIVRATLEPLRNPVFIMEMFPGFSTSYVLSILFALFGLAYMAFLHKEDIKNLINKIKNKKTEEVTNEE